MKVQNSDFKMVELPQKWTWSGGSWSYYIRMSELNRQAGPPTPYSMINWATHQHSSLEQVRTGGATYISWPQIRLVLHWDPFCQYIDWVCRDNFNDVFHTCKHSCNTSFCERMHGSSSLGNHWESQERGALQLEMCHQLRYGSLWWSCGWLVQELITVFVQLTLTCFHPSPVHLNRIELAMKLRQKPTLVACLLNDSLDKWPFFLKILLTCKHLSHAAICLQGLLHNIKTTLTQLLPPFSCGLCLMAELVLRFAWEFAGPALLNSFPAIRCLQHSD